MSKVVIVTGASSGIGLTIAAHLASKGFKVYGTSRSIREGAGQFKSLVMDVGNAESVQAGIDEVMQAERRIDVVINSAGLGIAGPVEHLKEADVANVFNTNLLGILRVSQAVLPHMRAQGSGLIINISSIAAEMGLPYRGAYSASKSAVDRLTEALRMEVKRFGIQACTVQPGGVQTDISKNRVFTVLPDNSPYQTSFDTTYEIINNSVSKGLPVEVFGPAIEQIIHTKRVKRNYRIGKGTERLSVLLKKILPVHVFEKIIMGHYKM